MVSRIVTHVHLLQFPELAELAVKVLVEGIEMLLDLRLVESVARHVHWVLVDVAEEHGL